MEGIIKDWIEENRFRVNLHIIESLWIMGLPGSRDFSIWFRMDSIVSNKARALFIESSRLMAAIQKADGSHELEALCTGSSYVPIVPTPGSAYPVHGHSYPGHS